MSGTASEDARTCAIQFLQLILTHQPNVFKNSSNGGGDLAEEVVAFIEKTAALLDQKGITGR